jgi:excisionase family DNA binding protein
MNTEDSILIPTTEACKRLGIGKSLFFRLLSAGRVGPKKITLGRRVLWNRAELEDWCGAGCPDREKWLKMKAENN